MKATGFQILFLYFAATFGAMLASRYALSAAALPREYLDPLGQAITLIFAGCLLIAMPSMRHAGVAMMSKPVPKDRRIEVAMTTLLNLAVPFGLIGAIALFAILSQDASSLFRIQVQADPAGQMAYSLRPEMLAMGVILGWLIGPLLEEIYFRGFLYQAWERQWGWLPATLLTSVAFGLAHPSHVISSILASLIFISVMRRTGTLRASFYVHSAYNILVFWPFFGQFIYATRTEFPLSGSTWSIEIACLCVIAVGVPLYLYLARNPSEFPSPQS